MAILTEEASLTGHHSVSDEDNSAISAMMRDDLSDLSEAATKSGKLSSAIRAQCRYCCVNFVKNMLKTLEIFVSKVFFLLLFIHFNV